jgi:hypothetical protein
MQLKSRVTAKAVLALRSAVVEHHERITNWLAVLALLTVGVIWPY